MTLDHILNGISAIAGMAGAAFAHFLFCLITWTIKEKIVKWLCED